MEYRHPFHQVRFPGWSWTPGSRSQSNWLSVGDKKVNHSSVMIFMSMANDIHNPSTPTELTAKTTKLPKRLQLASFAYHDSFFGSPLEILLVGKDRGGEGAAIVASPSHQHHPDSRHLAVGLEGQRLGGRSSFEQAGGSPADLGRLVVVGCKERLHLGVELHPGAINLEFQRSHFFFPLRSS